MAVSLKRYPIPVLYNFNSHPVFDTFINDAFDTFDSCFFLMRYEGLTAVLKSTNATVVVMMVAFIVSSVASSLENCRQGGGTHRQMCVAHGEFLGNF